MTSRVAARLAFLLLGSAAALPGGGAAGPSAAVAAAPDSATCAAADGCPLNTHAEEEPEDAVAALHTALRKTRAAVAPDLRQHEPSPEAKAKPEIKWRDALEHEMEHGVWLQAQAEIFRATGETGGWPWTQQSEMQRPMVAPNAQARPQTGPDGPYMWSVGLADPFPFPPPPPSEELRQMPVVRSSNGLLDVVLVVDWGWVEFPGLGFRAKTRLFNGSYPGPTLSFKRGDHLRIKVVNRLGRECPNNTRWQRREGQSTSDMMDGLHENDPRYQAVGQGPTEPILMAPHPNNMHDPNTTNFHTHGLHVVCRQKQDEVLKTVIPPGSSWTYEYDVSPYHSGGNSWYHPHWHGATTLQVGQGMIGAIIIEDSPNELPEWIAKIPEVTAVVHEIGWSYFGPDFLKYLPTDPQQGCFPFGATFTTQCALAHRQGIVANLTGDKLWKLEYADGWGFRVGEKTPMTELFTVNGQFRPTINIKTGEWLHLRIIFASSNFPINMVFNTNKTGSPQDGCEMYLLGKDNAYLREMPRKLLKGIFLAAGNRAQIIVRCRTAGSFPLQSNITEYSFSAIDAAQIFMFINVTGPDVTLTPPSVHTIPKARYLNDLVGLPATELATPIVPPATNSFNGQPLRTPFPVTQAPENKTITQFLTYDFPNGSPGRGPIPSTGYREQPVRFTINNMTFDKDAPAATIPVASVAQVQILGIDAHSWHMHTNPVQYVGFGFSDFETRWGGYYRIGDFADTISLVADNYDVTRGTQSGNYTALVRFQTDCYSGLYLIHCHVLYHEDLGMMTWFNVTGQDFQYNPKFENQGVFANPPAQCTKDGQQCAPAYCTNYKYGASR